MEVEEKKSGNGYFSLPSAPVFCPTVEEFKDAWTFLRSVSERIAEHGICVVQPPPKSAWDKNSFLKYIDPNTFRFATKVQNIHQLFNFRKMSVESPDQQSRVEQSLGYLPGDSYTLQAFEDMAKQFEKRQIKERHCNSNIEKEKQYWKIIEDANVPVQVHYGSDIDTSVAGSGFPLNPNSRIPLHKERAVTFHQKWRTLANPSDYMTHSPWNINNLAEKTFLHHINEQVGGITCPMLYVGMLFASFCWHTEDNYLYSINYNHHGADKIWYGVPARCARNFEAVVRKYLPEVISAHPNLFHLLVTQIPPQILQAEGVEVYTACQSQGQFVVTAPQGYHAGFNCGFNVAESVNFALEDWLPYCRSAVQDYRFLRRASFSYEEFVMKAAASPDNLSVAIMLKDQLKEIIKEEVQRQKQLYNLGIHQFIHDELPSYLSCSICGYDCFISCVACTHHLAVACLTHAATLCECEQSAKRLVVRQPIPQLNRLFDAVALYVENNQTDAPRLVSLHHDHGDSNFHRVCQPKSAGGAAATTNNHNAHNCDSPTKKPTSLKRRLDT